MSHETTADLRAEAAKLKLEAHEVLARVLSRLPPEIAIETAQDIRKACETIELGCDMIIKRVNSLTEMSQP